jgi:predicted DNA-binding protein
MTIHIEIPDPLAQRIAEAAKSQGKTPEAVVLEAVETKLNPLSALEEMLAPVYKRMEELGESEDETAEYLEKVKHEIRKERVGV